MQNPLPPWGGMEEKPRCKRVTFVTRKTIQNVLLFLYRLVFITKRGIHMVDEKTVTTLGVGIFPKGTRVQTASGFKGAVVDLDLASGRMAVLKAGTRGLYLFFNPGQLRPWDGE
jgi:hypothetical protein